MRYFILIMMFMSPAVFANESPDYLRKIIWQSCDDRAFSAWFGHEEIPDRLQCGYIIAPLSYDDENAKRVKLAVTRLPATGERKGSIISISGGPGISGVLVPFSNEKLNESYDIIGYDSSWSREFVAPNRLSSLD
ncbi:MULTISPECIES: hypothetical protein [Serratia]|uniref:hypothetical protein n=1 Tax=Serratia TaxID=613 RepID=UPI001EF402B1|nr:MULTISPECIES: hypothetical protein [Serratia]